MPKICSHWLFSLEEKNKIGNELVSQIRALHFSIQMITSLVVIRNDSFSLEKTEPSPGLVIYNNSAPDANTLYEDLQNSLDKTSATIEAFIMDSSKLVRFVESYVLTAPPSNDLKSLVDMCFAVNDLIYALRGWQNSYPDRMGITLKNNLPG
ncbi:hypothetical protein [Pseudomonas sp. Z2-11]